MTVLYTQFRADLLQYASSALTGLLANRNVVPGSLNEKHVATLAWKCALAMLDEAPQEDRIKELHDAARTPPTADEG